MTSLAATTLAIAGIGPVEMLVILIVAILIFGKRLPEIARGMGKSLQEFKKGMKEGENIENEIKGEIKNTATPKDTETPNN